MVSIMAAYGNEIAMIIKEEPQMDPLENSKDTIRWIDMEKLFNGNQMMPANEANKINKIPTNAVELKICDGCTERNSLIWKLTKEIDSLKLSLEKERKLVQHFKSLALKSKTAHPIRPVITIANPIRVIDAKNVKSTKVPARAALITSASREGVKDKNATESTLVEIIDVESITNAAPKSSDSLEMPFKCGTCNKCFGQQTELTSHVKIAHSTAKEQRIEVPQISVKKTIPASTIPASNRMTQQITVRAEDVYRDYPPDLLLRPFKCRICSEGFEGGSERASHMKTMHPNVTEGKKRVRGQIKTTDPQTAVIAGPTKLIYHPDLFRTAFKCGICDESFPKGCELQTHMRTHKESSIKYECRICKMKFNAPKLLEKHMKTHDIGNNEQNAKDVDFSKCIVCCEYAYEPHMCGEEKQIDCGYCLKKYTSTKELLAHLDTHNKDIKIYRCVECFKNFRMEILLKIHQKYHAEHPINKSLTCPTYSNVKLDEQMVKSLSNADSKKDENLHLCAECGKTMQSARSLRIHIETLHSDLASFQCPDCPQKFRHIQYLRRHSHVHRNCTYVCMICGAELMSPNGLRKHMLITHEGARKNVFFECEICSKKYKKKESLKKHMRYSHANTFERLECDFCGQSYKYKGDLNKHLRSHLGEKIYKCDECDKRFKFPNELRKHSFEHYKEQQIMTEG